MTKVVTVNVNAICEPSISVSDNAGEPTGEAPLF